MLRYLIEPGVILGLGEDAVIRPADESHSYRRVVTVDVELLEIPQSDISTTSGLCFMSERLSGAIAAAALSGLNRREFSMRLDEQMTSLGVFDGYELPALVCYDIDREAVSPDFAVLAGVYGLVVSQRALDLLGGFDLSFCEIEEFTGA